MTSSEPFVFLSCAAILAAQVLQFCRSPNVSLHELITIVFVIVICHY